MKDTQIKGLRSLPLLLRNAAEVRCGAEETLNGDHERSWHKAVKVTPGLCLRPCGAGDARVMASPHRKKNYPKVQKCTSGSQAGRAASSKPSDSRDGVTGLGVCPAGSESCFGLVIPPFCSGNLYSVCWKCRVKGPRKEPCP